VIRLGLRLALSGGREAVARLVIIAAAVALGTGMLLTVLAGINAVNTQNHRYAWLNAGVAAPADAAPSTSADPLWWSASGDYFHRQLLGRIDLAPTGPTSPVPPGIPRLPGPGEYYASPELTKLLRTTPADQLRDRFPGHQVGTIADTALPAPNSLIIVIGDRPDQLADVPGAVKITSIPDVSPSDCNRCVVGVNASGMDLVLSVVAGALLFPVLIFIGTATRLSAARREQRFAAMRLVGATPRQVSTISTVESTVATVAGVAIGFALFFLFRTPLAAFPFTGAPFFPSDLSLNVLDTVGVAVGVPVAAAIAARVALRRVRVRPLGVTRRVTPKPPRAYRLIPLLAGFAELGYVLAVGAPRGDSLAQVEVFLPGFLVVMAGLVIAGPWLTMVSTRVLAHRAKRPAALIAARRLSDDPKAGFRAISGLMLALFVTSVAVGVITTIVAHRGAPTTGTAVTTLVDDFTTGHTDSGRVLTSVPPTPDPVPAALRSLPGVRAIAVVRASPDAPPPMRPIIASAGSAAQQTPWFPGLVSCADLPASHAFGRCAPGADVASVDQNLGSPPDFSAPRGQSAAHDRAGPVWPTAEVSPDRLARLPVMSINVDTDGSPAVIEAARTILENAYPGNRMPATEADHDADFSRDLVGWQQLANVVILTSLPIAGCSLAVSVAGGLSDRKRPFSLLRLTGVPLAVLRRVVALETAVPLLVAAVVAAAAGFAAAHLFLRAQMGYTVQPPGVEYVVIVLVGLAASIGIVASTLPLLRRITGPETARNE
jgi:hypothetical protein